MNSQINYNQTIKEVGLKVTPARKAVFDIVTNHNSPIDIAHILKDLKKQHVDADQATIYRIVDAFLQKGLIEKLQFQEKKFYYELNREEHHHAVCTNCGTIEDIPNCSIDVIEKQIEKGKGFKVESHSLEFFGLCKSCK